MSYYSGLGAGKGWDKVKFVLTPDELTSIFTDLNYWFVKTNSRVPIDYTVTDKHSLFDNYRIYYSKIVSGQIWARKEDYQIESGVRFSITNKPNKIKFEEIKDKKGNVSNEFKLVRPEEPVINISPFYLSYMHDHLTIESSNDDGILGLEFTYPKVISFANEQSKSFHETSNYSNRKLFDSLTKRIKESAKKAKLRSATKTLRPNFWVSQDALLQINGNHYLIRNGLSLN